MLRVPSFTVILLQGAIGTAPWYAMGFFTLYLEERGLSHASAAFSRSLFDIGSALGNLIGGALSDWAGALSPRHGRILVAQLSVGSQAPLTLVLFYVIAADAAGGWLLLTGLLITWCGGVNNTIMAEVTLPQLRTTMYGLDRMVEGLLAPAGGYVAGLVAESRGFKADAGACAASAVGHPAHNFSTSLGVGAGTTNGSAIYSGNSSEAGGNAAALSDALALTISVPAVLTCLAYSLLHCTYAADKRRTCEQLTLELTANNEFDTEAQGVRLRAHDHAVKSAELASTEAASASL